MNPNSKKARVIVEHKERYKVVVDDIILTAEISGNIRYSAESAADFPIVGDYVEIQQFDNDFCIINKIYDRQSWIRRKSVSSDRDEQYIGANIDMAFIAQAVDRDFNIHRLDRYITALYDGKVSPSILLTKIDLIDEEQLNIIIHDVKTRHPKLPVYCISTLLNKGIDTVIQQLEPNKTYCVLGSSGVGKSTLLNALLGENHFAIKEISSANSKGQHTTSHRELVKLDNGSYFIDTPGMREFGMVDSEDSIDLAFGQIKELAEQCRYDDCAHEKEPHCAVRKAIENGDLDADYYKQYLKLHRESLRFSMSKAEKRAKDKSLGKFYREHINHKKNTRGF